jgi:hypothetical protein
MLAMLVNIYSTQLMLRFGLENQVVERHIAERKVVERQIVERKNCRCYKMST